MVQVDNTKKVGGNLDLGGADSGPSKPYMSPTDRHFAAGGSVFDAPGVKKDEPTESTKAQGGSLLAKAFTGEGLANGATGDANAAGDQATAGAAAGVCAETTPTKRVAIRVASSLFMRKSFGWLTMVYESPDSG